MLKTKINFSLLSFGVKTAYTSNEAFLIKFNV